MSRLDMITIAIVVVCLALLGFLVYKVVDLMKAPEDTSTTSIADTYNASDETADDTYNYDEEVDEANQTNYNEGDLDDDDVSATSEDEYDMDNTDTAEEDNGNTATATAPANTATSVDSYATSGQYMVIAGSYRQRVNADNQVAKLKSMGYNSAEVRLFDKGSFALVLVDRFNSKAEATDLMSELKGKGIDAFVQAKR